MPAPRAPGLPRPAVKARLARVRAISATNLHLRMNDDGVAFMSHEVDLVTGTAREPEDFQERLNKNFLEERRAIVRGACLKCARHSHRPKCTNFLERARRLSALPEFVFEQLHAL